MYQHPFVTEMLAQDRMARLHEAAAREHVAQSDPLLTRCGSLLRTLRQSFRRPAPAARSNAPRVARS